MRRKLVKQGQNALTVTLPRKWTKASNLKAGDEVDITLIDNNLLLSTEARLEKKETELKITTESEQYIRINLNVLYRLGYDKIKVFFETKKQKKIVNTIVEKILLGFEITDERDNYVVIENVTEPSEEKQEVLLKRMFLITKESFALINNDLKQGKFDGLSVIAQLTKKLDKYNNFCRRNISKKRFTEKRISYYWELYIKLILIQHSLLHLYEALDKDRHLKISKSTFDLFGSLQECQNKLYEGFFKKNMHILQKVNEKAKNNLYAGAIVKMKSTKGIETVVLYYLGELSRLIYLATVPMTGIMLR